MSPAHITLADVAASAGVSATTVSKVLNRRAGVAPSTRRLVLQQLQALEYTRTTSARPRPVGRHSMAVLFPAALSAYAITIVQGIVNSAAGLGAEVVLWGASEDIDRYAVDVERMIRRGRAGAILLGMTTAWDGEGLPDMARQDFPVIVVDPPQPCRDDIISVGTTNFAGGAAAARHLLRLGHRRIAHLSGPPELDCCRGRLSGCESALQEAGVTLDAAMIAHCGFRGEGLSAAADVLLDHTDPPTAVFAANDEIALALMEHARRRGLNVPDDLSIIGFDDTFLASSATPPLTTIAQPLVGMGTMAVQSLDQLLSGRPLVSRHVELATRLVVRHSTAAPAAR